MISEQLKHQAIEQNLQLLEKPPLINGNIFKFEQVILNILLNAQKYTGKETGRDLPISYQIIKEMNGNIETVSSSLVGTILKSLVSD